MKIIRIHFKDEGQDFLTWDVDKNTCKVVDAWPFQANIWTTCVVLNLWELVDGEETRVEIFSTTMPDEPMLINHKVESIEELEIEEG